MQMIIRRYFPPMVKNNVFINSLRNRWCANLISNKARTCLFTSGSPLTRHQIMKLIGGGLKMYGLSLCFKFPVFFFFTGFLGLPVARSLLTRLKNSSLPCHPSIWKRLAHCINPLMKNSSWTGSLNASSGKQLISASFKSCCLVSFL